jgi:20S proteasome alpha/beta subunit
MTICIAAVCENGAAVVVAADRMVTIPGMNLEVERQQSKILRLASNQLVMSSGDGLLCSEIFHELRKTFTPADPPNVDESADRFLAAYVALRERRIEELFTRPVGYSLAAFHSEGFKNLGGQLFMNTIQMMGQFNLGADFIMVGFSDQRARVAIISHPGTMRWFDSQEFFAIGSGQSHALSSLLISDHGSTCSREQGVFNVYAAKRVAERAPGVGGSTDLQIVTRNEIKAVADAINRRKHRALDSFRLVQPPLATRHKSPPEAPLSAIGA